MLQMPYDNIHIVVYLYTVSFICVFAILYSSPTSAIVFDLFDGVVESCKYSHLTNVS